LFYMYQDIMINQPVPWILISGNKQERFEKAKNAVKRLLFT
jgi:hypothetical protein